MEAARELLAALAAAGQVSKAAASREGSAAMDADLKLKDVEALLVVAARPGAGNLWSDGTAPAAAVGR